MTNSKSWYAVYCMPRWEKKVADQLNRKQVTNYCPLNKVKKQWSDRKKMVEEPLFKSYVFVQLTHKEMLTVKQTSGVLNFVYWLGQPAVIRDQEIETIKRFLNDYENVQLEKTEVEIDSRVRILTGPFMDYEGQVLEINTHTVKVQLPSLGYALVAKVDRSSVEPLYMEEERPLQKLKMA
jgi:transcription antitermination factor NusG